MNSIITTSKSTYHHADDEDETVEVDNEIRTSLPTNLASIVALNSPSLASVPMGYKRQMFGEDDIRVDIRNGMESLVYDPYNPLNKLVTPGEIETLLRHYGIDVPIQHFEFYKRAFVHRSYTKSPLLLNPSSSSNSSSTTTEVTILPQPANCLPLYTKSNERLEFVGDGVLECITKF